MSRWHVFALLVLQGMATAVVAQEIEPNDSCPGQHMGMPLLPFTLQGSLDTPPETPDIDFFRFDLPPGSDLRIDLEGSSTEGGTLPDPMLGVLDSDCTMIHVDDDGGIDLNSRILLTVPGDGVVVIAATSYGDFAFTGNGGASGSYSLVLEEGPALIGSIAGRLVDASDGSPISGGEPTYGWVTLYRCAEKCEWVASQSPNARGQFRFDGPANGLRAGRYQLRATASGYEEGQPRFSRIFTIAGNEDFRFGAFELEPNRLRISDVRLWCPPLTDGGVCSWSLQLHNNADEPFSGRIWSIVEYGLPQGGYSRFQVGVGTAHNPQPHYIWVPPGGAGSVQFALRIQPDWPALGYYACISAEVGEAPFAVQNIRTSAFIGCLQESGGVLATSTTAPPELRTGAGVPSAKPSAAQGNGPETMRLGEKLMQ